MILAFDTETTGLPVKWAPLTSPQQPHVVQLAALLMKDADTEIDSMNVIVQPDGWTIPEAAARVHGITTERAMDEGIPLVDTIGRFNDLLAQAKTLVAHNIEFDTQLMKTAFYRAGAEPARQNLPRFCTMAASLRIVNLPPTPKMLAAGFNKPKPPQLKECIAHFFGEGLDGAHDALVDVRACARLYWHLQSLGVAA
ncbi:3'-5' exonuclease [Azospirillum sp. A1-3]|uniref:3'-5' exonuclease n=1 Tax=Azospirillum sp. A1-3 TaxID=185874 RepID=UPI002076DA89|nr:3'-5' exonuclease [Azospirillum sp. A1-3]MCM8736637.1 3'-5' exonuclease [Azospirillum sp. A1-3]